MEEHCTPYRLQARSDNVIVARVISQVSKMLNKCKCNSNYSVQNVRVKVDSVVWVGHVACTMSFFSSNNNNNQAWVNYIYFNYN